MQFGNVARYGSGYRAVVMFAAAQVTADLPVVAPNCPRGTTSL